MIEITENIHILEIASSTASGVTILEIGHVLTNYSPIGHTHLSSEITDLASSINSIVSGVYAPLNNPSFVGVPTVPTAASGSNNNQIANTSFVRTEISNLVNSAPSTLDSLNELALAIGNDPNFATTIASGLGNKANTIHNHFVSDITDFNSSVSGLLPIVTNSGNNRVLTSTGTSTGINAENNLTFDGSNLGVNGSLSVDNLILDNNSISNKTNSQGYPGDSYPVTIDAGIMGVQISGSVVPTLVFNSPNLGAGGSIIGLDSTLENSIVYTKSTYLNVIDITAAHYPPSATGIIYLTAGELYFNNTPVSVSGHTHTSNNITDFNSSVSGLLPVKDIIAGNDISISSSSGIYTINSTVTSVDEANSLVTTVFNKTGSTIPKMSVVYIDGGQGDQPTVQLAIANSEATSSKTYGITAESINNMSTGKVIVDGALKGLNTDQFNPNAPQGDINGTVLYLSPSISGGITTTKPSAPNHIVSVGTVVRTHQNEGIVEVRVQNGFELQELHNVAISGVNDGQFLQYNSGSGLWIGSSSGNFTSLYVNNSPVSLINEPTSSSIIVNNVLTLDMNTSRIFLVNLNDNINTITINNIPTTANISTGLTIIFTGDGTTRSVTWPLSVKWPSAVVPALTSTNGKQNIISLVTNDNGTSWLGFVGGLNY
jgi:hypothetical protein